MKSSRLSGVAVLSLISGSGWLLAQAYPSEIAWPFAACLHFGLIGLAGMAAATVRGQVTRLPLRRTASLCAAGVCLFVLPGTALQLAAGKVPEFTSAAMFCAVPLMTVLASMEFDAGGETARLRGLMLPGVAGLGGAMLLFPLENPGSLRRWSFLVLALGGCFAAALASVWMHRLMRGVAVTAAAAVIGLGCAAALAAYGYSAVWPAMGWRAIGVETLRGAVLDLPIVCLTVWLAREVHPARLAARFLLAPLVTVLEGYAIERGPVEARVVVAVALMCAGGVLLLVRDEPEELLGLQLR